MATPKVLHNIDRINDMISEIRNEISQKYSPATSRENILGKLSYIERLNDENYLGHNYERTVSYLAAAISVISACLSVYLAFGRK